MDDLFREILVDTIVNNLGSSSSTDAESASRDVQAPATLAAPAIISSASKTEVGQGVEGRVEGKVEAGIKRKREDQEELTPEFRNESTIEESSNFGTVFGFDDNNSALPLDFGVEWAGPNPTTGSTVDMNDEMQRMLDQLETSLANPTDVTLSALEIPAMMDFGMASSLPLELGTWGNMTAGVF
jgi:hypothetical protein